MNRPWLDSWETDGGGCGGGGRGGGGLPTTSAAWDGVTGKTQQVGILSFPPLSFRQFKSSQTFEKRAAYSNRVLNKGS